MKKILLFLLTFAFLLSCSSCTSCSKQTGETPDATGTRDSASGNPSTPGSSDGSDETDAAYFPGKRVDLTAFYDTTDFQDVSDEDADAVVILSGTVGMVSDESLGTSGGIVTLKSGKIYHITGSSTGVTVQISDSGEAGDTYLILDQVTMTHSTAPCIRATCPGKLIINCVGENFLASAGISGDYEATIRSEGVLTVNGEGSLTVGSSSHGIAGTRDVRITGSVISITASSAGVRARNSIRMGGGKVTVKAGTDGILARNQDGDSCFIMTGGELNVTADRSAVVADTTGDIEECNIYLYGGTLNLTAGEPSTDPDATYRDGIRCEGDIIISACMINVPRADHAIRATNDIEISGGTMKLTAREGGIFANGILLINTGTVTVADSLEGLKAFEVSIKGGTVSITATDDGISAAGGSDTVSKVPKPAAWTEATARGGLTVSGGNLRILVREGDGMDSDGSVFVTGGTVVIEGPASGTGSAIDYGDGAGAIAFISGGTVLALGAAESAVNFNMGTQCSGMLRLSGSAGTVISVGDGSDFRYPATNAFSYVLYSSPAMNRGSRYTVSAGKSSATMSFASGLYYSNLD